MKVERCESISIPIILRVWPFTLPKTPTERSSFGVNYKIINYKIISRTYRLNPTSSEFYRLMRRYYDLLLDHRVIPSLPLDTVPLVNESSGEADYDALFIRGLGSAAERLEG